MNKSFLAPILFFAALLIIVYIILPEFYNFNNLSLELETRNKEVESIEKYHQRIDNAFNELENYEQNLEKINSALPDNYSPSSLFNYLQKTSEENGMFLSSVSLAKNTGKKVEDSLKTEGERKEIKENYVNVSLIGSYNSFKTFLKSIEKSSRIIEVESILTKIEEEALNFILLLKVSSY